MCIYLNLMILIKIIRGFISVEQAFNRALAFCIQFAGTGEASVELNKTYEIAQFDSAAITALLASVQSGNMRIVDFIRYMQGANLVPQDEKPEDVAEELELIRGTNMLGV
ncbi:hypothetical protein ABMZ84_18700 [Morganella morganii]|uniref:hypothetical protein n=1 Tax=Morganella morganii TaxID=582 RepID=UPI003EC01060